MRVWDPVSNTHGFEGTVITSGACNVFFIILKSGHLAKQFHSSYEGLPARNFTRDSELI